MSSKLHPIIAEQVAKLMKWRKEVRALDPHAYAAEAAVAAEGHRFSFSKVWLAATASDVWITVHAKSMEGVVALRRRLAQAGYHVRGINEYPDERRLTQRLHLDGETFGIVLDINFPSDDAACRYVQVGTKEVPVYELKCKDAAEVTP